MKEKVYIETSIIGAYFDDREDIASRAQKFWTRRWWDELGSRYEIVSSDAVIDLFIFRSALQMDRVFYGVLQVPNHALSI